MGMRTLASLLLSWTLSGCGAPGITLDIKAGPCVNPPDSRCNAAGTDSRLLEVRLYQLAQPVDPCRLSWEDFAEGKELDRLKGALADPQRLDATLLKMSVDRNELRRLPPWPRLKGASHLLIVTVGRNRGRGSIRLVRLEGTDHRQGLYFSHYDVCLGLACDSPEKDACP